MIRQRPARYRSKTTGRFVSEEFAHEHPGETYAVGGGPSPLLVLAAVAGLVGVSLGAVLLVRARR